MGEDLIGRFLNNRSSGANELALKELEIISSLLKSDNSRKKIKNFITAASKQFPEMAPIQKIKFYFEKNDLNQKNIEKLSYKFSNNNYIDNSSFLFDSPQNILTFSNSSSVRKAIINYNHKINKIFCCRSLPLAEGKVFYKELQKKDVEACLIEDMEITEYSNIIDFILIGADAIGESYFINKLGTKLIALFAKYYDIPLYVITSSVKFFSEKEFAKLKIGKYFEKLDKAFVTKFIF